MANKTIGGADKALSAEMGKGMYLGTVDNTNLAPKDVASVRASVEYIQATQDKDGYVLDGTALS